MRRLLFFVALSVLVGFSGMAQQDNPCGFIPDEAFIQRTLANKAYAQQQPLETRGNAVTYIPVKFHLIAKSDGTGRLKEKNVLDALCKLNEVYADMNIQFYLYYGIGKINNTNAFTNPGGNTLILAGTKVNNALNIYVGQATGVTPAVGTNLGFYSTGFDLIVTKNDQVNGASKTIAHEVGHYFSLLHPFYGWDGSYWNEAEHGNPVNLQFGPYVPQSGPVPVELANGSNCDEAGDFLCDTPANYGFGFGWPNCNFSLEVKDQNGDVLNPDETNIMSYFSDGCTNSFSSDQQGLMLADIDDRNLDTNFEPFATTVDGEPELLEPADGATTAFYNDITLSWSEVPGATKYLLEVDFVPFFNFNTQIYIVDGTSKTLTDLNEDATYHWRVRPFNDYYTCTDFTDSKSFTTGLETSTSEPKFVSSWNVIPNPAISGTQLNVQIDSDRAFEGQLELMTMSGQVLSSRAVSLPQGNSNLELTADLTAGIYLLTLKTQEGVLNKRIVIIE